MGLKYSSFAIRGVDVSQFNGTIDWTKIMAIKPNFSGIRLGFGVVPDDKAERNWKESKYKVNRLAYWYIDYYSNHIKGWGADGVSDRDWGRRQAEKCWLMTKADPSGAVFADIENGNPAYAEPLSAVKDRALAISKAFLERMDELNGRKNGIYCSLGLLDWFSAWFMDRPLWVAWYNEAQTVESVRKAVAATGWTGKCLIWQYASHGCTNGDGVAQGLNLGTELKQLDLNVFMGTAADYAALFGAPVIISEDETTVIVPEDETPIAWDDFVKYQVNTGRLMVRSGPSTNSKIIGSYLLGAPINITSGITPGIGSVQGWVEIFGQDQYMSLDYLKKV